VIKVCLKYKCAFAWNVQEVSDVEECTQPKTLKVRCYYLHVCTVHKLYQNHFLLFQLMHTIIKS